MFELLRGALERLSVAKEDGHATNWCLDHGCAARAARSTQCAAQPAHACTNARLHKAFLRPGTPHVLGPHVCQRLLLPAVPGPLRESCGSTWLPCGSAPFCPRATCSFGVEMNICSITIFLLAVTLFWPGSVFLSSGLCPVRDILCVALKIFIVFLHRTLDLVPTIAHGQCF